MNTNTILFKKSEEKKKFKPCFYSLIFQSGKNFSIKKYHADLFKKKRMKNLPIF